MTWPIDFQRLVDGLAAATAMTSGGQARLPAVEVLVTAAQEATGAAGATFTEYAATDHTATDHMPADDTATDDTATDHTPADDTATDHTPADDTASGHRTEGGRVVVAIGSMDFALGQPVGTDIVNLHPSDEGLMARVDSLPAQVAEPLLGRGVRLLLGRPVRTWGRVVGAVHLYLRDLDLLTDVDETARTQAQSALRVVAAAIAHAYCGPAGPPRVALADDDRTLFLAVAGHELRTPVTVVKGYASMLADRWESLDDPARRDAARVLGQRADELARLVDRLLGASVGDGVMGWMVGVVPFDLVEALLRAVNDLPAELRRGLRLDVPSGLPLGRGDPAILTSVVAELVTNAVRSTAMTAPRGPAPRGPAPGGPALGGPTSPGPAQRGVASAGPALGGAAPAGAAPAGTAPAGTASAGAAPASSGDAQVEIHAGADADTVFIRVCDRGVGIDPGHVERAFEKFWRARPDGEGRCGVGLGLFLVRRLVERQQGWVSLRPRDGGGAVAEVRLPRADGPTRSPVAGEA